VTAPVLRFALCDGETRFMLMSPSASCSGSFLVSVGGGSRGEGTLRQYSDATELGVIEGRAARV